MQDSSPDSVTHWLEGLRDGDNVELFRPLGYLSTLTLTRFVAGCFGARHRPQRIKQRCHAKKSAPFFRGNRAMEHFPLAIRCSIPSTCIFATKRSITPTGRIKRNIGNSVQSTKWTSTSDTFGIELFADKWPTAQ